MSTATACNRPGFVFLGAGLAFFGGFKVNQSKQKSLVRERLAADEKAIADKLKARDDEIASLKAEIERSKPAAPVAVDVAAPRAAAAEGDWLDEWFGAAEDISADRAKKPAAAKKH